MQTRAEGVIERSSPSSLEACPQSVLGSSPAPLAIGCPGQRHVANGFAVARFQSAGSYVTDAPLAG